jgi:hypothetical protein
MTRDIGMVEAAPRFSRPSLDEQAELAEKHGIETLLFCPNP